MVENFIVLLTGGVYLATLSGALGISDSMTAILSSVTALSGLFQIITVFVAHKTPVKRWIVPLQLLADLMLCGLYLIPTIGLTKQASILFFVLIIGANAVKSIISSVKANWFFSMVRPESRGSFSGILTAVSVVAQIFFSLIASYVFDSYIESENIRGAFAVITVTILVLIVFDLIPLIIAKEKPLKLTKAPSPFASLKELFSNPKYKKLLILGAIQAIATAIAPPFLGTYQMNELGFSLSFIAITDIIVNVVWVGALLIFGRMSKKLPYSSVMHASAVIHAISYSVLIFAMPSNGAVIFTLYRALYIIQASGTAVANRSLLFDLVEPTERTSALAIYTMITGVISFAVTVAIAPLFNLLQSSPIKLFGVELYAQQALAIGSLAFMLIANVFWAVFARGLQVEHRL